MSIPPDPPEGEPPSEDPLRDSQEPARSIRAFHAGEVLYREGDLGEVAYLLDDGVVRLIKKVRGTDRSLLVLRPGDIFGEAALNAMSPRTSTAVAMSAGVARTITRETLDELIAHDPSAAAHLVKQLIRRLADAEDQVEIMMLSDTQSKVVRALLKLAQQARADGPGATFIISPMELSARIGLDIDTVKRTVQQLRDGQYLRVVDGRLDVPDIDAMRRLYSLLGIKDELRTEGA